MTISANPNPLFQPAMRVISSIIQGKTTTFTTTFAHQYKSGLIVRIVIPDNWGMQEMNMLYGPIVVLDPTTFTMAINSSSFDPLVAPSSPLASHSLPQVVPIGEINSSLSQATQNVFG